MNIHNVSFSYAKNQSFINQFNATIQVGNITSIVGPNGSGKSTVLSLLARQLKAKQGEISLYEQAVHTYSTKEWARQLAVVHQQNEIPQHLSVRSLIAYGRFPHRDRFKPWSTEDEGAVSEALAVTGLSAMADRPVVHLSGGERQRVWLALSLAQQTPFLLLDEPTTYLDLYHQYELLDLIQSLKEEQGKTIVMVIHDLNQALQYSDDIWVMRQGKLVTAGDVRKVMTSSLIEEVFRVKARVVEDQETRKPLLIPTGKV
ncbi:ABC transporter ATP-binding protein [Shouchella sp. 1P09AA]|uniref:ABC transporter ATP-binding protein n=1 Tax=unclassified Shouchella TaxID=2893065 RepID=UPI0039A338C3